MVFTWESSLMKRLRLTLNYLTKYLEPGINKIGEGLGIPAGEGFINLAFLPPLFKIKNHEK
jgi:hypothetical protein